MVIERDGQRWEARLPGRQGRLLFAYLAVNRHRTCSRDELAGALWGEHGPAAGDVGLNAVLSKLRRALGPDVVQGRTSLFISERVFLPDDDTEWIEEHRDRLRDIR